ncbi:hypothetical protein [Synoicihabitans lomoniglobus]|uniref:Lipopolysaccharide assembly protein A domain-containing protein n=1 Tax=Synoicihabitans lomoniglobus TaxID=2909285 RepID=A0AAE9ZUT4_9BACT|nr:hypothetical protein [Opitutaceae bacterium LMO-M01]WED63731.1 hypothetical protein PXH66_15450 [Opitutaceae bacterium LMO-M01]
MKKAKLYFALIASALMAIVIFQNTDVVVTRVLFITIAMPRAALLAITLLIGIVIGISLALGWGRKGKGRGPKLGA